MWASFKSAKTHAFVGHYAFGSGTLIVHVAHADLSAKFGVLRYDTDATKILNL